jgi:hypothetical protein
MFFVAGGHWGALQSVAWAGMLWNYTQADGSLLSGVQKTFDGEVYNIEEIEVREPADFEPVVRRICSGLNSQSKTSPSPAPLMQLSAETSPGEVLDRITILELKEQFLSGIAVLHDVRRELLLLRTRMAPHLRPPRADLNGIVADLKAVNLAAWNTNELISNGFPDDFGQQGWHLDIRNVDSVGRSEELIRALREAQRLNRQRVGLKAQINQLLGFHTIEEKPFEDSMRQIKRGPDSAAQAEISEAPWSGIDSKLAEAGLHAVQFELSARQRDNVAAAIAKTVNEVVGPSVGATDANTLQALRSDGILTLGQVLSPKQVMDIVRYFSKTPCYDKHVAAYSDGVPRPVEEAALRSPYGSYRLEEALQAPHLLELAMNEKVTSLCEQYLGCLPTVYSVHVWWTFAGQERPGQTHSFHRDQDDHRFLSMFTYLTDVGPQDGPIDFLVGTHRPDVVQKALAAYANQHPNEQVPGAERFFPQFSGDGYDDEPGKVPIPYETLFPNHHISLTGSAGSAFIADTYGLHRGNPPSNRHRLACWIRYGLSKHRVYVLDKTEPVAASSLGNRLRRSREVDWISRLIVDQNR